MKESERLADNLYRVMFGPAWHGDDMSAILYGIEADQAARKGLENAHSIWEIVVHAGVWQDVAFKRVAGFR